MNPKTKAALALTATALFFGAALPIVKPALEFINPQQFLFLRYVIAFLALTPILIVTRQIHSIPQKARIPLIIIELSAIGILLIVYTALNLTTSLTTALILSTRPLFTTIAGILLLKEHETRMEFFGLLIAVIGTTLIITTPFSNPINSLMALDYNTLVGSGLVILTNVIAAFITVGIKKHYSNIPNLTITFHHLAIGSAGLGLLLLTTGGLPSLSVLSLPQVALPILYMAIFGSIIGLTLYFYGISHFDASKATLFSYLQPLIYIPLGVFWLHESISVMQLFGLALTVIGFLIAESKLASKRRLLDFVNLFRPHPPLIQPQHV